MHMPSVLGRVPIFILAFFIADLGLVCLYGFDLLIGSPFELVTKMLDLGGEENIPTWYASSQLFCIGLLTAVFAWSQWHNRRPTSWLLLALPFSFFVLSMDETCGLHEWIGMKTDVLLPGGSREDTAFSVTGIWVLVLGIPVLTGLLCVVYFVREYLFKVKGVFTMLIWGFGCFLGLSLTLELASNLTVFDSPAYRFLMTLEELCEKVGATIILWAFWKLLRGYGYSLTVQDPETPVASSDLG